MIRTKSILVVDTAIQRVVEDETTRTTKEEKVAVTIQEEDQIIEEEVNSSKDSSFLIQKALLGNMQSLFSKGQYIIGYS